MEFQVRSLEFDVEPERRNKYGNHGEEEIRRERETGREQQVRKYVWGKRWPGPSHSAVRKNSSIQDNVFLVFLTNKEFVNVSEAIKIIKDLVNTCTKKCTYKNKYF